MSAVLVSGEYLDPHCDGKQVIVHLFEWKWTDIAKECERFLSSKGFCGVQVGCTFITDIEIGGPRQTENPPPTHMHAHSHTRTHTYTQTHTHIHTQIYTHRYTQIHTDIFSQIYVHKPTYIDNHIIIANPLLLECPITTDLFQENGYGFSVCSSVRDMLYNTDIIISIVKLIA